MASIIEPKVTGFYVVKTVHGSYRVQHLHERQNCAEFIEEIIDGPFEDYAKSGKIILAGQRIANAKLSEYLAQLSRPDTLPS
jgi:hypothetical protein